MPNKKFLIFSGVVCAMLLIFCALGVYLTAHSSPVIRAFAASLDLPFGSIDGSRVGFRALYRHLGALEAITGTDESRPALTESVWQKMQREKALEKIFDELHLTWNDDEFKTFANNYITAVFGSAEELRNLIKPLSIAQFQNDSVRPLYLEQVINKKIILEADNPSYDRIQELYVRAKADPSRFADIVEEYAKSINLPSLNTEVLLAAEELPSATAELFRTIPEGSLTPIIASHDGYHVYYIRQYFTDPQEAWQAEELFIAEGSLAQRLLTIQNSLALRIYNKKLLPNE